MRPPVKLLTLLLATLALTVLAMGCSSDDDDDPTPAVLTSVPAMTVTSNAFEAGGQIPIDYSCDGRNVSPQVTWSGAPADTRAFVLLLTDPDAPSGNFDHWVVYDIKPEVTKLSEAASGTDQLSAVAIEGKNGRGDAGYTGPCPPKGSEHGYHFTVYALSRPLALDRGQSRQEVEESMAGKVIARGELVGRFGR
jgi:Raf kinase inhibitor-like YbhB/YbcL family protein